MEEQPMKEVSTIRFKVQYGEVDQRLADGSEPALKLVNPYHVIVSTETSLGEVRVIKNISAEMIEHSYHDFVPQVVGLAVAELLSGLEEFTK